MAKWMMSEAVKEAELRSNAQLGLIAYTCFTYPPYSVNWHHEVMAHYFDRMVEGAEDRLMFFTPPRHGKSELITVRGNGYYLGRNPHHSIIGASYADSLARTFSRAVRNVLQAPQYQKLWPLELATEADTNWQITGRGDERPSYIAAGVGGGISGQGAHLLNIDDPIKNAEEADSSVVRESQWNWYTSTARTRLMKDGRIVLTLTRWHEDDIAGRLIQAALADRKADQWTIIVLPATNDHGGEAYVWNTRDGVTHGENGEKKPRNAKFFEPYEALWPEVYPRVELDRIKASVSPRWWNALYQQRPTALAGGIIQREWFMHYLRKDLPLKFDNVTQSWDMAFKDKKTSSYVCGQVWARWRTREYLIDQVRDHWGFAASCNAVRQLTEKWPAARTKLVEDKANGPAIMDHLRDELGGFIEIEPQGSKEARLEAASPQYMARGVYHPSPEECSWILGVEEELLVAPNGTYWDQADCVSQYLNWQHMRSVGPISHTASKTKQVHSYLKGY